MSTESTTSPNQREPELLGQTVVLIGGSAGIGRETARGASAEGAKVILTGRDRERLIDMDFEQARRALDEHMLLMIQVPRNACKVRPGGTLLFMGGTGGRRPGVGFGIASTVTAALRALTANLALELAPIRVNLIAPGFVDTPLSASLLGDALENRRKQLRETLPIRRVVGPADVAALAVHMMVNTALTGATYDIDGGQQLVGAWRMCDRLKHVAEANHCVPN